VSVSSSPAERFRGPVRVALLAGGLAQGGAERQLLHLARALRGMGADVRVYSLTNDGTYHDQLRSAGIEPIWVGRFSSPPARTADLGRRLASFRPHVVQACHSFVNLYAGLAGRACGSLSLGALRSSLRHCREANGRWTRWLMSVPDAIVTNSDLARRELLDSGLVAPGRVFVLPNAVDLAAFAGTHGEAEDRASLTAAFVGRIVASKRLDVFLRSLAVARGGGAGIRGVVIGTGPALPPAQALAASLGLGAEAVTFLGERPDVPALLAAADMLVLTSDDEGLPNVLLEAMAAGLPVVSTPAGDAARIVETGVNGVLVPFGDVAACAGTMVELADSPALRRRLGGAARESMRRNFALESLPERLRALYRSAARLKGRRALVEALS
jgi:glycosyltransferase involved in cell wall biosynthesis